MAHVNVYAAGAALVRASGGVVLLADVKHGFQHTVMDPDDRPLMAIIINGVAYQPMRLMFGLRQGPAHFSLLTTELITTVTT